MIKANHSHKSLVIEILSSSFDTNQSVNYIIKQDKKRQRRIEALMEYSFLLCLSFGAVWLSDDLNGCVLLLYPHKRKMTLKAAYLDLQLIFKSIGIKRVHLALNRESRIKEIRPAHPSVYLWFIGINPNAQGKGLGSELLKQVLVHAKNLNLPVYLETSVARNLDWYEQFGFKVYNQVSFSHTLYFLTTGQ